ncbi:hypothetical protein JCM8097_005482 [Rhodosporidiobolus ruineniae]
MLLPDDKHRVSFPRLNDVYAFVQVEGEPLEVYGLEEKDGKAVAYVEAQEGKEFEVVLVDLRRVDEITHDWTAYYHVDGISIDSLVTAKSDSLYSSSPTSPDRLYSFWGKRTSLTSLTPLRFGRLQLTDNIDEACQDQDVLEGLGTMRLEYCRVQVMAEDEKPDHFDQPSAVKPVHEEAKKATFISHQADSSPLDLTRSPSPKPDFNELEDLEAELASLRRQERITKLEREARKRKRANEGRSSSSPSSKKIKLEAIVIDDEAEGESGHRRMKREEVAEFERRQEEEKRSGKKPDVLDVSDE